MAVALVDARDQLLADVAREVEVDVRQRGQLLVQKAPDQQLVGDRVDVREAGQVADDRGDARAAPSTGREQSARGVGPAHLGCHLARQLEHVVVQQEEPGQVERLDDPQLLLGDGRPPSSRTAVRPRIAVVQPRVAQLRELAHRHGVLRSRVAIAEIAAKIELQTVRQLGGLGDRLGIFGEARGHRLRGGEHVAEVAAPLWL